MNTLRILTAMLLTLMVLISFGCAKDEYAQNNSKMDTPMTNKDSRDLHNSNLSHRGMLTDWPYTESWAE